MCSGALTSCGGGSTSSKQSVVVTKISSSNATQITQSVNSSMAEMNLLQGVTVDYSQNLSFTTNAVETKSAVPVARTIYCGAMPEVDSGKGLIQMSYDFTLSSVSVNFDFLQCQYSETVYVNGRYDLAAEGSFVDIISGNARGGIRFTSTVTNLNVVSSAENVDTTLDGNWANELFENELGYEIDFTADVTLASTQMTKELMNWQQITKIDTNIFQLSVDLSGQYKSSDFNGMLSVMTIAPIVFQMANNFSPDGVPTIHSGQFKISAVDNSSVLITVLDSDSAQLEIDSDGDGVIDVTRVVAISDLDLLDLLPTNSLIN